MSMTQSTQSEPRRKKLNGEKYGLTRPKKWVHAYMWYVQDKRKDNKWQEGVPFKDMMREVGSSWQNETPEVKEYYR